MICSKTKLLTAILCVVFLILTNGVELSLEDRLALVDIDQIRTTTIQRINRLWRKLSHQDWERTAEEHGGKDVRLLEEYRKICDAYDTITPPSIPTLAVASIWSYAIIEVEANGIIGLYNNFRKYQQSPANGKNRLQQRKWQDFAENVVEDTIEMASVSKAMDRIDEMILGDDDMANIYKLIIQDTQTNLCNVQQSPQQLIYNIYLSLQMTQLKGYTMMQFSWMLLRLYEKGNFTVEAKKSREKYIERTRLQVQMAKKAMDDADQSMWRCDPVEQVEEETYTQITRLLQGYIQNEVDLNNGESCSEDCSYYSYTKQFGCFKNNFCSQQRGCGGRIVDCQFIDSDMTVCQADSDVVRYNWIKYENGKELGDTSKTCSRRSKVDSWWRWLFWHCSYCLCLCDDPYFSDRYFNLRPVTSDIDNNKVITAVRFVKADHIIHLQIQEGTMLPKGAVNESTLSWRKVDEYKAGSTGVQGKDYHMLSWEERAIDLDEIRVTKPTHVMTGIKFRMIGTHLNLEIRETPLNFTSGQLIQPNARSEWISNDNTDAAASPRTEVKLDQPDVPTRHKAHRPMSHHDQFMRFTHTDFKKDVAQHTVPFIDTQIVAPQPPTPLIGAGIMYRSEPGSGGYLAPKLFTYNLAQHLQEDFDEPSEQLREKYEL